jgi:hypothetical protein
MLILNRKIQGKAIEATNIGDIESASNYYNDLLEKSTFGFFKLIAEAGLCHLTNRQTEDKSHHSSTSRALMDHQRKSRFRIGLASHHKFIPQ